MAWAHVVGQNTVKRLLQRAASQDRLPHALLLAGQDGAGTLAVAITIARALTCDHPLIEGGFDACGECRSCMQSASLQHPNITVVTALPPGKADVETDLTADVVEELAHQLRTIATDPYAPFGLPSATQIRIGQLRELKRQLAMSGAQEGKRVVIIHHAEDMTTEAANAFLKTLEEPHADVILILTSAAAERLLPTISSRCQRLNVPPLDDDDVVTALITEGVDSAKASLVASFSDGDLTRARGYLREDVQSERAEAVDLLRAALRGRDFRVTLVDAVNAAADRRDRQRAIRILRLLALWLRDVQSVLALGEHAPIANVDQRSAIQRFAESFGTANLSRALDVIDRGVRDVRRNVTIGTVLLTTLLELRSLFYDAATSAARPS